LRPPERAPITSFDKGLRLNADNLNLSRAFKSNLMLSRHGLALSLFLLSSTRIPQCSEQSFIAPRARWS
jgi:hypothetical protein